MLGNHNRKEQALALMAGNGILLLQLVAMDMSGKVVTAGNKPGWAFMMCAAIVGLACGFFALSHAAPKPEPDTDRKTAMDPFPKWAWASLAPLGFVLALLFWTLFNTWYSSAEKGTAGA